MATSLRIPSRWPRPQLVAYIVLEIYLRLVGGHALLSSDFYDCMIIWVLELL